MSDVVDETLVKLKIIASMRPFQKLKITANNNVSIDSTGNVITALARWWMGDSRNRTVQYIRSVITDAVDITQEFMKEKIPPEKTRMFSDELKSTIHGMDNLQRTYAGDLQIVSLLEVIKQIVRHHVTKMESYLSAREEPFSI